MPLGEVLAEIIGQAFFEAVLVKPFIGLLRLPGALIGWCIWRKRTFGDVWRKGDAFGQGMAGGCFHAIWIVSLAASCG